MIGARMFDWATRAYFIIITGGAVAFACWPA